jgi:hypothetical protein
MSERGEEERERVAAELRRVRETVRERALLEPRPGVLPRPRTVNVPGAVPPDAAVPALDTPERPDNADLNQRWRLKGLLEGGGWRRRLARGLVRVAQRLVDAQEDFNARQVRFDNDLLAYVDRRLEATHRHYDAVLGVHGRHMGEIDERHLILQEELVAHVHDLVKRVDLVLAEAERGRLSLEFALKDLRARVKQLEERAGQG